MVNNTKALKNNLKLINSYLTRKFDQKFDETQLRFDGLRGDAQLSALDLKLT